MTSDSQESVTNVDGKLAKRLKMVQELRGRDITHFELQSNNFEAAERIKLGTLKQLEGFIHLMEACGQKECPHAYESGLNVIDGYLANIKGKVSSLETMVEVDSKRDDFPSRRSSYIEKFELLPTEIDTALQTHRTEMQVSLILRGAPNITVRMRDLNDNVAMAEREALAFRKKITNFDANLAADQSRAIFERRSKAHFIHELVWAVISGLIVVGSLAALDHFYHESLSGNAGAKGWSVESVESIIRRFVVLTIPLVFLRIALQKYNTERYMRISYDHRISILEQFKTIEGLLTSENEPKEGFRMEVARAILSTPAAGYLSNDHSANELNITPIIDIPSKIVRNSQQGGLT